MTCKLIIKKSYHEIKLNFDTLVEAGEFINTFSRHAESDKEIPWEYTIIPVMDNDSDGIEDDIPVK